MKRTDRLTDAEAHRVYDILVEECGAYDGKPYEREGFVRYMTGGDYFGKEWRFQGHLGFGGKCYMNSNRGGLPYVSCYREDETPQRLAMIERANARIAALFSPARDISIERDAEGNPVRLRIKP